MKSILQVEGLSKAYRIGVEEKKTDTITEALWQTIKSPLRNFRDIRNLRRMQGEDETLFWALKDLTFDIQEGEVLGIIGHNGAGKSTLLKILSRITEPTSGRAIIQGRVSSLLEVGTGFHADLTGRENIYMNGTILGMRKKEIDTKLEEIIAFSGISQYIDTPVKRYSSGMSVRLAFSVAAHLDPEILIIDEVLAVGDADFQKKCIGKMNEVARGGRTVLFVSHNLKLIESLCTKGLVLNNGRLVHTGEVQDSLRIYKSEVGETEQAVIIQDEGVLSFKKVKNKEELEEVRVNQPLFINILFNAMEPVISFHCDIAIQNEEGFSIIHSRSTWSNNSSFILDKKGEFEFRYNIANHNLAPGIYFLEIYIYSGQRILYHAKNIEAFKITSRNFLDGSLSLDNVKAFVIPEFEIKLKYD